MRMALTVVFSAFLVVGVFAQDLGVEILNHKTSVFLNKDCKKTKTCDLKKVEYFVEDYRVFVDGAYSYGTRFFARYETKSVKNLEKYVFVQFIKGCGFYSKLVEGQVVTAQEVDYPRDKGNILFRFPEWTIDSRDEDPVYSTFPDESRFFGYRWNTVPNSFSTRTEKLYGEKKPKSPKLYVVDHPGSAFYTNSSAKNISLQFRIGIYRTKDVPVSVAYDNVNFAEPLHYYEWSSSFVYDHLTERFENPSGVVPACQ